MRKYNLINLKTRVIMKDLTIDESMKEEFKKFMDWDEMTWRRNTSKIAEKTGVKK